MMIRRFIKRQWYYMSTMAVDRYTLISLFEERKLYYQSTSKILAESDYINKMLEANADKGNNNERNISMYCGYDPTASSLHLGNLVSIIMMARVELLLNIRPIFLLGGATGQIGDPSGKKSQRSLLQQSQVSQNLSKIHQQINTVYNTIYSDLKNNSTNLYNLPTITNPPATTKALFINNQQFYTNMNILQFLRNVGKHLPMSSLLAKQHISSRLHTQSSISYTQFTYSLLQAYDFYRLHKEYDCYLQLGGSDQWGNIVNGCTLLRRMTGNQSKGEKEKQGYGVTMPLLLSKNGEKFGKSQGNALFLDKEVTPTSQIYDYLYNTSDEDIEKLLYIFTFYSPQAIQQIIAQHKANPQKRIAQKTLAESVVKYLVGSFKNSKEELLKLTQAQLQSKRLQQLDDYFEELQSELKAVQNRNLGDLQSLPDLLVKHKITSSRKQARRQIQAQGIYLNNTKIPKQFSTENLEQVIKVSLLKDKYLVIRRGKKRCFLLKFQS